MPKKKGNFHSTARETGQEKQHRSVFQCYGFVLSCFLSGWLLVNYTFLKIKWSVR